MTDTTETALAGDVADFTRVLTISAAPAAPTALRAAITTDEGVSGWWMPTERSAPDSLHVSFGDTGLDLRVVETPELVVWDVVECSAEPDWVGTTIEFATATDAAGTIELVFTHRGLGALPCAENCFAGWTHFLPSLQSYVECGKGNPGARQR